MSAGYLPPTPAPPGRLPSLRSDAERNALVEDNLPLVHWLVRRFLKGRPHLQHLEDDLVSEGVLGLLRAAELFDPAKGAFTTIAYYWALQKVQRYAADNDAGAVRVPVCVKGEERARLCRRGRGLSLSRPLPRGNKPDVLLAGPDRAPGEALDHAGRADAILGALRRLPGRWRAVVELRFGLGGEAPLTLAEVGQRLGVTRERVRQIEAKALERLRKRCPQLAELLAT